MRHILKGFAYTCCLLLGCSAVVPAAAAAEKNFDGRFYLAPLGSWAFVEGRQGDLNPGNDAGGQLSIGKPVNQYLALEVFGAYYPAVDLHHTVVGDVDLFDYGLSALVFPDGDSLPVFGLVSIGGGSDNFSLTGSPGLDQGHKNAFFYDVGVGFLLPLTDLGIPDPYGFKIRGEYRFRESWVHDVPGHVGFNTHILSLGLEIPLGRNPNPPEKAPPPAVAAPVDSDNDGVPDSVDQCPGTPAGVAVDKTGCPKQKARPIVLKGVTFEYDSAKLTAQAQKRLDNVVDALAAAKETDVLVAGNTDSKGSAPYNLKLSQRRADSVKAYLVTHGIDGDRLTTVGYGETRPVAPNTKPDGSDNPAGRAQNRRVELNVIEQQKNVIEEQKEEEQKE